MIDYFHKLTHGVSIKCLGNTILRIGTSVTYERFLRTPGLKHHDKFVVSWILKGEGRYQEDGNSFPITDFTVCIRRPDRDYTMELYVKSSVRLFLDLPDEIYKTMILLVPELNTISPVVSSPFCQEYWNEFMSLRTTFDEVAPDDVYKLLPAMIHFICDITGIFAQREKLPLFRAKRMLDDVSSTLSLQEIAEFCNLNY